MSKSEALINQFSQALQRLDEVLAVPENDISRDSAIQRFEFTLDLAWKSVKAFLEESKGLTCNSPKDCFRQAFQQQLIAYNDVWIELVDIRNETVHTYNLDKAKQTYSHLKEASTLFHELQSSLKT